MFKTTIFLCHFLGITIAGHRHLYDGVPHPTGSGHVQTVQYTNNAPESISYNSASIPTIYQKSFYYFTSPDEYFEQRHSDFSRKLTTSQKKNVQVILVKSNEQKAYESAVLNLTQQQQQQHQQQQTQVNVFNKQTNMDSLLQNLKTAQYPGGSSSQQQIPEVHFINYNTDAEADKVIQQITRAHNFDMPNVVTVSHGRVQAAKVPPLLNSVSKSAANDNRNSHAHSTLSLHKNYAMNYLPTGVDVVPGSSYIPLRRI